MTSKPSDPDPAAAALERHVQAIHDRAASIVEDWCSDVREDAARATANVFTSLADVHGELIEEIDWTAADAATAYRRSIHERVLTPLEERLENDAVEDRLEDSHNRLSARLRDGIESIPPSIARAEPDDLYRPEAGERTVRRIRKARIRWGRAWRKAARTMMAIPRSFKGRGDDEPPGPEQTVPLRRLAAHHLSVRLPDHLDIIQEALHQVLGRAVADVARSVTEHGHETLLAESAGSDEPPESGETAGEGAKPPPDLRDAATAFNASLRQGASDAAVDDILQDAEKRCTSTLEELRRDVRQAGTFMLDLEDRKVDGRSPARETRERSWHTWHAHVRARIGLTATLFALREETRRTGSSLVDRAKEDGIDPATHALARAEHTLRRQAEGAGADFEQRREIGARVRRRLDDALAAVDREALAVLRDGKFSEKIREAAEATTSELASRIHGLAEKVEINALRPVDERVVDPGADPLTVELREHASRAYDAIVLRRLQTAAAVVADGLRDTRQTIQELPDVLRFNLESALDELTSSEDSDLSAARELAVGGLERSANVLREAAQGLMDLHAPFARQVEAVIELGFDRLHERMRVEVRMRGQILDLRSGAVEQLREVTSRASEQAQKSSVILRRAYLRGVRRGRALLEMGQAAAGLAEATEEERMETVEALSDVERLIEQLPLVYRRLFSFQPSTDASMLAGRERDLALIRKHVDLWIRGMTNALVLSGYHGSGLTSMLNVARQSILKEADVSVLDLRVRVRTEEDLAARLAEALDLADVPNLDGAEMRPLVRLENALSSDESTTIRACFVEHIEHLYLRQIGGTELIEKFLTFVSRTDAHILWIATVSDTAWQVITRAEPVAAGLVTSHALSALSRADLESLVLNRHRRSGLPIHFEAPAREINPIVARRYRRAKTEEERQEILREEYFDRLHRVTGQNIMLALLYWLRSVETDSDEGLLRVRPLEPLSFSALERFDLDRAFALRALLEHTSLSIEEHSELAQTPIETSRQLFQSLDNLLLIEPFENGKRGPFDFTKIEEGVRYRIRPLLIHPVTRFLRSRNIVH